MILAAGLGTRLKPLTDRMPKALVPVGGTPLIDRVLGKLHEAGATEVVVNVHHLADQLEEHLKSREWGLTVRISDERRELLDTGGGLRHAKGLFTNDGKPILIHNVDILSNADLRNFYQSYNGEGASLLVSNRQTQRYLMFDADGRLCGWTNLATGAVRTPYPSLKMENMRLLAFSGIHCFSPKLFPWMDSFPERFSIIDFYLSVCDKVDIRCYEQPGLKLLDVGKLNTLHEADRWVAVAD